MHLTVWFFENMEKQKLWNRRGENIEENKDRKRLRLEVKK